MLTLPERAKDLVLRIMLTDPGKARLYQLIYEEFKEVYRDGLADAGREEKPNETPKIDGTIGLGVDSEMFNESDGC